MPALGLGVDSGRVWRPSRQQPGGDGAVATQAGTGAVLGVRQNSGGPSPSSEAIVPATYGSLYDSPPPGTVVAIVVGSVAGFLLLMLLVYAALGFGPALGSRTQSESVVDGGPGPSRSLFSLRSRSRSRLAGPDHHPGRKRRRSRRRSRRHAPETVEVRTREHYVIDNNGIASRQPIRVVVGPSTAPAPSGTTAPTPHAPPRPSPGDDDDGDDEVVVIEEHSPPPPRRKSRRHSGRSRRSDEEPRRATYRDVETRRYVGGGAPLRHVKREESRRYSPSPER